jgi:hypothetical protein
MKNISALLIAISLSFLFAKEVKASNPAHLEGYFYSSLSPYGTWISIDIGVYAWRPTIISRAWSPYKIGRWVWTDYGWYWDSYEPFGFIVYHYGRWHYDDYYGWIWIPDYEWAPAWVEWRYDDYYIGWAPLPPYAIFRMSIGIVYTHSYVIPVSHWHFVKYKYFGDPYCYNYLVPEKTKYRIHSNTKYRNDYRYSNGRVRNEGVEFDFVRQRAGDNIRKRDLVITDNLRDFETNRTRDRDKIVTFIADRDRILTDRESLKNVDVTRNDRKTSLDLSRVELGEIRNRNEVRNRDNVSSITRENSRESRQDRNHQIRDNDRRDSERRNNERRDIERTESERREIERREAERRRSNEILEQRRNEELEQRRRESREIELNRHNQREHERRDNSWIFPNSDQQRGARKLEERRIERDTNPRDDAPEIRNHQRNENLRNESRDDVRRDRDQSNEQRQRVR